VIPLLLASLTLLSLALTLWQWIVARRFPLHRRVAAPRPAPDVTLLKPLKGSDMETVECLRSWLRQDYSGEAQILFGVAADDDPACAVVRDLLAAHPKCQAQLVLCGGPLGPNAKVSKLAHLERLARHDILIVSDADVRVPRDFLAQVVAPLQEGSAGLVNCFYRFAQPSNVAMRWEAFAVNADFWSQVLQAQSLKSLDFALGAVMATTRVQLARIGGFAALTDYLADDYQLGHQIARSGATIALCPVVVECWSAPMNWADVWRHQLRWARTIRACQPVPYFFSILSNATLWPLLLVLSQPSAATWIAGAICLLTRMTSALYCERKLTQLLDWHSVWLAPTKDLLQVVIWAAAYLNNNVMWRGERLRLLAGGKLARAET
jgi:ceramide glucosyltransferase